MTSLGKFAVKLGFGYLGSLPVIFMGNFRSAEISVLKISKTKNLVFSFENFQKIRPVDFKGAQKGEGFTCGDVLSHFGQPWMCAVDWRKSHHYSTTTT